MGRCKRFVQSRYCFVILFAMAMFVFSELGSVTAQAHTGFWYGQPVVKVREGFVQGFDDNADTLVWKGIPYAAPPVDDLRWKAPANPERWLGVRAETEFCDMCPQLADEGVEGSEDCLYLNVWRPNTTERDLPVFVWIHGGGNSIGSGGQPSYDGAYFANRNNAIYVSINYRLGPMGWFTLPALRSDETSDDAESSDCMYDELRTAMDNSGNYGTLDMIKALRWIRKNIRAFGGDKHNVTIAGESAGGHNVVSLLLSPLAEGLFDKAIAMSTPNAPGIPMEVADLSSTQALARLLVNDGTAASIEEAYQIIYGVMTEEQIRDYLRSKTAEEMIMAYDAMAFTMLAIPTMFADGTVIVGEGGQAFEDGTYPNKVPTIIGSTKDEMKLFMAPSLETIEAYFLALAFPEGAGYTIATQYNSALWVAEGTDQIARAMAAQPDQPDVYVYRFLWGSNPLVVDPTMAFVFGSHHGRDVEFFLGNQGEVELGFGIFMNSDANEPGRMALTNGVIDYLGNFMRSGDPNGGDLPQWPVWVNTVGEPKAISMDADLDDMIIEVTTEEFAEEAIKAEMEAIYGPEITEFILSFSII